MKLKTFLYNIRQIKDEGFNNSSLIFLNYDGEYLNVSRVEEEDNVISLVFGDESAFDVEELEDQLKKLSPLSEICAYNPVGDITYSIESGWGKDDDGDVYIDIHESHRHKKNKKRASITQDKYSNTDTSKYITNYDENGLFENLSKFAKRLGIKTVYIALWLYYALKCVSLAIVCIRGIKMKVKSAPNRMSNVKFLYNFKLKIL